MTEIVFLIEQRQRGPMSGNNADWTVDPSSPIMDTMKMAERQATEWNEDFPTLDHCPAAYIRVSGGGR